MASGEEETSSYSPRSSGGITFMLSESDADRLGGLTFLEDLTGTFTSRTGIDVEIEAASISISDYNKILKIRLAAGDMADVFTTLSSFDVLESVAMEDLSGLTRQIDFLVQPGRIGDEVKSLPYSMDVSGILYNTRMVPSVPGSGRWALDDLAQSYLDRGERFFAGGQRGFPLQAYILFDLCLAAELLQDNPRWPEDLAAGRAGLNFPEFTEAVQRAAGLFKCLPKDYPRMTQEGAVAAFQRGDHPAIPVGTWNHELLSDPGAPLRFDGFPVEGERRIFRVYPYSLAVYAHSRNKPGALKFVEFLLSQEVQEAIVREGTGASPLRGIRYPEGVRQQLGQALDNAGFLADMGLYDMMIKANISYGTVEAFYTGLYRAAAGGGNLGPVIDELNYQYFQALGMKPPSPPESSGSGGANAPNSP